MLLSEYFLPTLRENPKDAVIPSHQLMIRSGMIRQASSGVYHWLPMGIKVLNKLISIVQSNMDDAGALQIIIPLMQSIDLWKKSERYGNESEVSKESFITKDRNGNEFILSPTAEEIITKLFSDNIRSIADLPKNLYQIHWKFRNEIRPRYGVLRCREFLMKDAYSFDSNYENALISYKKMLKAYMKICTDIGIKVIPVLADSGDMGGDYTHEIHVLSQNGESTIYYEEEMEGYQNADFTIELLGNVYARESAKHDVSKVHGKKIRESKGIEVGQLFLLGDHYTKIFNTKLQNIDGTVHPYMGCYGIGVSRLVGAIIEANHDDNGIIWPKNVAPFKIGIIAKDFGGDEAEEFPTKLYKAFVDYFGVNEVLYDDRDSSLGNKYHNMDLIGTPLVITVKDVDDSIEIKIRKSGEKIYFSSLGDVLQYCIEFYKN